LHAGFLAQRREEAKAQKNFILAFGRENQDSKFHSLVCPFLFPRAGFFAQSCPAEDKLFVVFGK
jgi:hypothetical protein